MPVTTRALPRPNQPVHEAPAAVPSGASPWCGSPSHGSSLSVAMVTAVAVMATVLHSESASQ